MQTTEAKENPVPEEDEEEEEAMEVHLEESSGFPGEEEEEADEGARDEESNQ